MYRLRWVLLVPNDTTYTQALINALQLQRNIASDNVVTLQAELAVAKEEIKELKETLSAGAKDCIDI